jgi:GH24 family phage-related lysozyme (muramidase)
MIPKEDDRNDVYPDSRQIPTVGIGHKVVPADKLKIGDLISDARKEAFWRQDSAAALQAAQQQANEARISDAEFLVALADVNFQLGRGWRAKFKEAWALILAGNYDAAAHEVRDSKWFKQTPNRVENFRRALLALSSKRTPKDQ